jgi:hypothetical protein
MIVRGFLVFAACLLGALYAPEEALAEAIEEGPAGVAVLLPMATPVRKTRPKVPMHRIGADCSVVVMKRGNARGAKGAGHRHWIGSTGNGTNPIINGRRQPSLGGTSRMMREYHVRICEGLG